MMRHAWIVSAVAALLFAAGTAWAQTASAPVMVVTPPPSPGGPYEQLSPGNQKIAQALFQAQQGSTTKPLSLDEIAAMKQKNGWGVIARDMRSRGLIQGNLGQAVSQFNHQSKGTGPAPVEITTASGKTVVVGGSARSADARAAKGSSGGERDGGSSAGSSAASGHGADAGVSAGRSGGSHGAAHGK